MDLILQTHILKWFTSHLLYFSFNAQDDGKGHLFALQVDNTSK